MTTIDDLGGVSALRSAFSGPVVLPGEDEWDVARAAWNLAVDQRPAAVAFAASADDVADAVRFAQQRGLGVALQSTGHGGHTLAKQLADTVLLRTSGLRGVEIDTLAQTARVGAGTLWGEVISAAAPHGLAALHGSSPGVGVAGYSLGGGIGWLARRYGLQTNSIRAFDVVTADGEHVRVDAVSEPDLFWALRGGGGSFAAVTAIEFQLYPVREVYAGALFWPQEQAGEVFSRYLDWIGTVPDEVTSCVRLLNFPDIPMIPAPLRGRNVAAVEVAFMGDAREGEALVAPLRRIGGAFIDSIATMPVTGLGMLHGDPQDPVPGIGHHALLRSLDERGLETMLEQAGPGSQTPLLGVELRQLGGALARPAAGAGALPSLDGDLALFAIGVPMAARRTPRPSTGRCTGSSARWRRTTPAATTSTSASRMPTSAAPSARSASSGCSSPRRPTTRTTCSGPTTASPRPSLRPSAPRSTS